MSAAQYAAQIGPAGRIASGTAAVEVIAFAVGVWDKLDTRVTRRRVIGSHGRGDNLRDER